jgi:hypothetical protein
MTTTSPTAKPVTPQKPVRVIEGQVTMFRCPLCSEDVKATTEVEVRLGDLDLKAYNTDAQDNEPGVTGKVYATVKTATRIRRLTVDHDCRGALDQDADS